MRTRQWKEGSGHFAESNGFRELLLLTPVILYINCYIVTEAFKLGPVKYPWDSVNCPLYLQVSEVVSVSILSCMMSLPYSLSPRDATRHKSSCT